MANELLWASETAQGDTTLKVLVITGEGKAFWRGTAIRRDDRGVAA